jgi:predicted ArsR family transcriptional regulator
MSASAEAIERSPSSIATRNESFHSMDDLASKRREVYEVLKVGPMSDRAIAKRLNWSINRVTPRRGELVKEGLVRAAYKDMDAETKRKCIIWEVTNGA